MNAHGQYGRVTPAALILALGLGCAAYVTVKYVPLYRDFALLKATVAEAGQRAISLQDRPAARAWFDQQMRDLEFDWLRADQLYWHPVDRDHLDVGVRYEVKLDHVVGRQAVSFSWYCTATAEDCTPFRPSFSE
ncbi:MAG: hypothetical protein KDA24_27210 [Deltaproteobacteria bacterium]|nr:hypothetical protein [Deltaproteobacteria bacterium]